MRLVRIPLLVLTLLALTTAACGSVAVVHPTATPTAKAAVQPTVPAGTRCAWAGRGATLAFSGKRLNFTCGTQGGNEVGLIGNITLGDRGWEIEKAVYARGSGGALLTSSSQVLISHIELTDGTRCAWAGRGATLAFDGKRLNFTCGNQGEDQVGLIGTVLAGDRAWEIEKVVITRGSNGFTARSTVKAEIAALIIADK